MKNVLCTGGNGFLGKNLQQYVKGLDLEFKFYFPKSKDFNCLDMISMKNYIDNKRIDSIIHLGARCGGILANKNSPADFIRDNTYMALNIYEIAREYNIKYVLGMGTTCAYPKICPIPFKEKDLWNGYPEETNAFYSQSKRTLLMLGNSYREQYGIKGCHLIPANMFGIFDNFDLVNSHVIPALINKFVNAKDKKLPQVELWGTGDVSREFLFAQDCCEAIIKTLSLELDEADPINIGNGKEIFIKDLATIIASLTKYEGQIVFTGDVSNGQPRRCLDVSKAKKLIQFKAKTNLKSGLQKTVEYYQSIKV